MEIDKPHHLYRHFNKDGVLLYVGISLNAITRLMAHRDNCHWWNEIASITIESFPDRNSVRDAERMAIYNEKPLHNIKLKAWEPEKEKIKPEILGALNDQVYFITMLNPLVNLDKACELLGRMNRKTLKYILLEMDISPIHLPTRRGQMLTSFQILEIAEYLQTKNEQRCHSDEYTVNPQSIASSHPNIISRR